MSKLNPTRSSLNKNLVVSRAGFTMIEVMLVLAISGLIFMGIFIALPNAQRNQRNAARRSDYTHLSSAIADFTMDNNGRLPTQTDIDGTGGAKWLNESGKDPDDNDYNITVQDAKSAGFSLTTPAPGDVYIIQSADCNGTNGAPAANGNSRSFAIYGYMDDGSADGDAFCLQSNA